MHLGLNMAQVATGGIACTGRWEMQHLITTSPAKVREVNIQEVTFPRHSDVKLAMGAHPAMLPEN
jgi:hypothetical protein